MGTLTKDLNCYDIWKKFKFGSKLLFARKQDKSGLCLKLHNTCKVKNGDVKNIKFVYSTFNVYVNQLAILDQNGIIYLVDLDYSRIWVVSKLSTCSIIVFSPFIKNEVIVGLSDGTLLRINTEFGTEVGILDGHTATVLKITFANNTKRCISISSNEIFLWDMHNYIVLIQLILNNIPTLNIVLFAPVSEKVLAFFQNKSIQIWDNETLKVLNEIKTKINIGSFDFTRNGRIIVIGGDSKELFLFEMSNWHITKVLNLPPGCHRIKQLNFIPEPFDGGANKVLAILSSSCHIYLMDINSSVILTQINSEECISRLIVSYSGSYISLLEKSGQIEIYGELKLYYQHSNRKNNFSNHTRSIKNKNFKLKNHHYSNHQSYESVDGLKLQKIIRTFGELPNVYRKTIWNAVLKLPSNKQAYSVIALKGDHPTFTEIGIFCDSIPECINLPLKRLVSNLAYWSPIFSYIKDLPLIVCGFCKLHRYEPMMAFETVATIFLKYCQCWFEDFPLPSYKIIAIIDNIIAIHDNDLYKHYEKYSFTSEVYAWPLMISLFYKVLTPSNWLHFWDNVLCHGPSFLLLSIPAFNLVLRDIIITLKQGRQLEDLFSQQGVVQFKDWMKKSYELYDHYHNVIPLKELKLFLHKNVYNVYTDYPRDIISNTDKTLSELRNEEKELLHEEMLISKKISDLEDFHDDNTVHCKIKEIKNYYETLLKDKEKCLAVRRAQITSLGSILKSTELSNLRRRKNQNLCSEANEILGDIQVLLNETDHECLTNFGSIEIEANKKMQHLDSRIKDEKMQEEVRLPGNKLNKKYIRNHESSVSNIEEESVNNFAVGDESYERIEILDDLTQQIEIELARIAFYKFESETSTSLCNN